MIMVKRQKEDKAHASADSKQQKMCTEQSQSSTSQCADYSEAEEHQDNVETKSAEASCMSEMESDTEPQQDVKEDEAARTNHIQGNESSSSDHENYTENHLNESSTSDEEIQQDDSHSDEEILQDDSHSDEEIQQDDSHSEDENLLNEIEVVLDHLLGQNIPEEEVNVLTVEERLQDEMFEHVIAERKIRFNKMQSIKSLQDLCVKAVINHLDYFCCIPDPLSNLPPLILTLLKERLNDDKFSIPEVVLSFITEHSKSLSVKLCEQRNRPGPTPTWTIDNINFVFELISQKCENKLTHLTLKLCLQSQEDFSWVAPQPSLNQLHDVITHQTNLIELKLKNCGIKNDTLAVIGSTCEQLISLDVSYNKDITDEGILYLCGDSRTYGRCLKIKHLYLKDTSVNHPGMYTALLKLLDLEHFSVTSEKLLLDVLLQFVDIYKDTKKLNLTYLKFDDRNSHFVNQKIENICKILPNVTHVEFIGDDLTPLFILPKIHTLSLYTDASDLSVANLIVNLGSNLIELSISESNCTVDMSLIGHFCPNIKKITLFCSISETFAYEILPFSFQKLEHIGMYPDNDEFIPSPVFIQMLSSQSLTSIDIRHLPEQTLLECMSQARENNAEIFSNLVSFDLVIEHEFSFETWMEFLCVAANLKSVFIMNSEESEVHKKVKKFAARNDYMVLFSY